MKDSKLRSEIIGEVRKAMSEVMTSIEERWVSPEELSKQFSFFTKDWLRHYGHLIPRERVAVAHSDNEGVSRTTAWAYPLHKINLMVAAGEFRRMEYREAMKQRDWKQTCTNEGRRENDTPLMRRARR